MSIVFSRYPSAPARSAAKRSVSSSETVSITIFVCGSRALISQAAARPLPGIWMSSRQTSGWSCTAARTASGGIRHLRADIEPVVSVERPPHVLAGRSVIIGDQHPQ